MRLPVLKIDRREYVLVPRSEYESWDKKRRAPKKVGGKRASKTPAAEIYTDERVAEFLLNNSADEKDYVRAQRIVRKMGLDPAKIDHDPPVGVA